MKPSATPAAPVRYMIDVEQTIVNPGCGQQNPGPLPQDASLMPGQASWMESINVVVNGTVHPGARSAAGGSGTPQGVGFGARAGGCRRPLSCADCAGGGPAHCGEHRWWVGMPHP